VFIIAHRGYSIRYPECTEIAYRKAIEAGADFIEIDVMMSRDRRPVVFHARDLSAVSTATGKIGERTLDELKQVSITAGFGDAYGFQPVLTLEETLDLAKAGGVRICAEIKDMESGYREGYEAEVMPLFRLHGMDRRAVLNTSNDAFIEACRRSYPDVAIALDLPASAAETGDFIRRALALGVQLVELDFRRASSETVRELRCAGLAVWVWPVNREEDMERAVAWGADGILTDDPALLKAVLRRL
jgi:glycerophosphoryl diester phosphodiesterase